MVKSAVKVVLRTRPSPDFAYDQLKVVEGTEDIEISVHRPHHEGSEKYRFHFDGILHDVTQEEVFDSCTVDILDSFMQGINGTIMCYGQTGAGKTYTMTGGKDSYKSRGMVPRSIARVFEETRANPDLTRTIRMSYVEIYNEKIFDLLNPSQDPSAINVVDGPKGSVAIKGLSTPVVMSEEDALELMFEVGWGDIKDELELMVEGECNRAIAEHQLNKSSSRSHAVLTLYLDTKRSPLDPTTMRSKLHLVDLAGSERLRKTKSEGTTAKEATFINKSLSFLEQVIVALGDRSRDHVPYRSSKLTYLLKDSLGGNSRTLMVANIWGERAHLEETISTCRFAQRMMRVACDYVQNVSEDTSALARNLGDQVAQLKEELAMYDAMSNRAGVCYDPYTPSQRRELREQVVAFFDAEESAPDSISPLSIISVRHVREILLQCRELYVEARSAAASVGRSGGLEGTTGRSAAEGTATGSMRGTGGADVVEDGEAHTAEAREGGVEKEGAERERDVREEGSDDPMVAPSHLQPPERAEAEPAQSRPASPPTPRGPRPSRTHAFEEYKKGPGAEGAALVRDNKAALKDSKARAKEAGLKVNAVKKKIDEVKARAEEFQKEREAQGMGDEDEVEVSEEEYAVLTELKSLKGEYKAHFGELKDAKSEVEYVSKLVDQSTKELALAFDDWYIATYGPEEQEEEEEEEESEEESSWGGVVVPGGGATGGVGEGVGENGRKVAGRRVGGEGGGVHTPGGGRRGGRGRGMGGTGMGTARRSPVKGAVEVLEVPEEEKVRERREEGK